MGPVSGNRCTVRKVVTGTQTPRGATGVRVSFHMIKMGAPPQGMVFLDMRCRVDNVCLLPRKIIFKIK
jgi:hypothetical protein